MHQFQSINYALVPFHALILFHAPVPFYVLIPFHALVSFHVQKKLTDCLNFNSKISTSTTCPGSSLAPPPLLESCPCLLDVLLCSSSEASSANRHDQNIIMNHMQLDSRRLHMPHPLLDWSLHNFRNPSHPGQLVICRSLQTP